jgi:TonB system transport protein ExbD (group 1)
MAIVLGGDGTQVKRHSYQQNAEMNITPFVDVILVLLIIFMVAAPLATVDVPVDLPRNIAPPTPRPSEPVYVTVQKDGAVWVNKTRTNLAELAGQLAANAHDEGLQTRIFVNGDQHVEYGQLMEVINVIQKAGYSRMGLVGEPRDKP